MSIGSTEREDYTMYPCYIFVKVTNKPEFLIYMQMKTGRQKFIQLILHRIYFAIKMNLSWIY